MVFPSPLRAASPFAALLLAVLPCAPAAAAPLTFAEAVRIAAATAPRLDAERSQAAAALQDLARADALPDPKLMAGVQNLPVGGDDAFRLGADRMSMRRLGVSQEFPSRAAREARRSAAGARLVAARAGIVATALDVRRSAAEAWIALWAVQREQAMLRELEQQSELAVRTARARLSGGGGSASEVLAAQAAQLELANRLADARARIATQRAALARWLGTEPGTLASDAPAFTRLPFDEAELLARLDATGDLLLWDARQQRAQAELALARAETRPDWALSGGVAQRGGGASDVVWLEVSVDLPLFRRDRQDRAVAARYADLQAVEAAREDARRAQGAQVRALFAQWQGLAEQARRYRSQILPLAGDRSRTALAAFSGGAPLQPWMDARRDELSARVAYARVLADWGRAWAALAFLLPAEDAA